MSSRAKRKQQAFDWAISTAVWEVTAAGREEPGHTTSFHSPELGGSWGSELRNGVDEPKGGWGPEVQVEITALLALVKKKKK